MVAADEAGLEFAFRDEELDAVLYGVTDQTTLNAWLPQLPTFKGRLLFLTDDDLVDERLEGLRPFQMLGSPVDVDTLLTGLQRTSAS